MSAQDYRYEVTDEQIRAYLAVPDLAKLQWLEDLCAFTHMVREAPATYQGSSAPVLAPPRSPSGRSTHTP